ncbi:MAG: hypothetical protein GX595_16505 [Lentisphaerae bacterium]|nr:hypothetical protein [Lentisphaerota bacterium]
MADETRAGSVCTEWQPEAIVDLLVACGRIGLEAQSQTAWTLKQDGSLVTETDRAIEQLLSERFDRPAEGSRLIGEETVASRDEAYIDAALEGTAWIVDPIDGTAPFAHGLPSWGTSIGFARGGRIEHGAIVLPVSGELLVTVGDEVWWAHDLDLRRPCGPVRLEPLPPRHQPLSRGGMIALGQRFVRTRSLPWSNPAVVTGCAIQALAWVLLGRVMGCIGHMKLWDVAGVLPMLERAGFVARLADGAPMTTAVADGAFLLAAGHPERWAQRDHVAFGPTAVVEALLAEVLSETPTASGGLRR